VAARSPRTASGVQSGSRQTVARAGSIPATSTAGAEGGAVSSNVRKLLSMGFSYLRVMEAHSIFGDHISNMLCYLMETDGCSDGESVSRRKGKAAE
jgi:OTU domain-containing protein 5